MTIIPITVFSSHILSREFWCGCFFWVFFVFLPLKQNIVLWSKKSNKKTCAENFLNKIVFNRLGILCDPCKDHRMVELLNTGWSFRYVSLWNWWNSKRIDIYTISWMLYDPFSFGSRCVNAKCSSWSSTINLLYPVWPVSFLTWLWQG